MIVLRALVRLVSFLLLLALALIGGAVALFSIQGGDTGLSIPALASNVRLPALRDTLDTFLGSLEGSGPVAAMTLLGALAAVALGVLLLLGALVPRRERMATLESTDQGTLTARRRPLAHLATALVERAEGVTHARVRVRPRRTLGGRLKVRADRSRAVDPGSVEQAVGGALEPLTGPFGLKAKISSRLGGDGSRVQ